MIFAVLLHRDLADTDGHRVVIFREGVSSAVGVVESGEHFELTFPTGVAWIEGGCLAITDSGTHKTGMPFLHTFKFLNA